MGNWATFVGPLLEGPPYEQTGVDEYGVPIMPLSPAVLFVAGWACPTPSFLRTRKRWSRQCSWPMRQHWIGPQAKRANLLDSHYSLAQEMFQQEGDVEFLRDSSLFSRGSVEREIVLIYGSGSKLNRRGYAGFGPCFYLPGFHFGTGFLSHSHIKITTQHTMACTRYVSWESVDRTAASPEKMLPRAQGSQQYAFSTSEAWIFPHGYRSKKSGNPEMACPGKWKRLKPAVHLLVG